MNWPDLLVLPIVALVIYLLSFLTDSGVALWPLLDPRAKPKDEREAERPDQWREAFEPEEDDLTRWRRKHQ